MLLGIAKEVLRAIEVFEHMHCRWAEIRAALQALPDMVHAMVDVVSLCCIPGGLVLLMLMWCVSFVIAFCSPSNVAMAMCTVIVLVELLPHGIETVQVVEDVERKVILVRYWMLVFVHVIGKKRIQGYLLWCDGWVFVLEEFSPCGIDSWARSAEVEGLRGLHLSVYPVARLIEKKEIVEADRGVFVWQGGCSD